MFKNKKVRYLVFILIIFLVIIAILSSYLVYKSYVKPSPEIQVDNVTKVIETTLDTIPTGTNPAQVEEALKILNNPSLTDEQRYAGLSNLVFYFATGYSITYDPKLREIVRNDLNNLAKNMFPDQYEEGYFELPCTDPTCGDSADSELLAIQKEIKELDLIPEYHNTINSNLQQTIYLSEKDNKDDKMYGFAIVISGLEIEGVNTASESAKKLREYVKKKYDVEFQPTALESL
jgi:hypothetical protein